MARIAIIGGGLMGAGIAQVFAAKDHEVTVFEPVDAVRETVQQRIKSNMRSIGEAETSAEHVVLARDLPGAVAHADFVIEAAPERLALKRSIFAELTAHTPRDAILASNTSVIPIGQIAKGLGMADRIVGTHWWNPPYLVPLVEVVQAPETSDASIEATMKLLTDVGKKPAHIRKDVPGFVANRLQHALWREAIAMVAEGICDAQTLDDCVKNSFGLRLPVLGPLENADLVGLDLTLDIHRTIIPELDRSSGPHPFLERLVSQGRIGFKSGEGFRPWNADDMQALRARLAAHLLGMQRRSGKG